MPHEFMFVTMWRNGLCFWMRMAQANAELGLRMWQTMGFPPPPPMDPQVEALCAAAARPADTPDPVTRPAPVAAEPEAGGIAKSTATPRRTRPVARRSAAAIAPVA